MLNAPLARRSQPGGSFATLDVDLFRRDEKTFQRNLVGVVGYFALAALYIGTLVALIPENAIGVFMVIDVYLVSVLMTVVILAALLTREARRYFWSA